MGEISASKSLASKLDILLHVLRKLKIDAQSLDLTAIVLGDPRVLIQVIYAIFVEVNPRFTRYLVEQGFRIFPSSDYDFMASLVRLLREKLNFFPELTTSQFFQPKFSERKLEFLISMAKIVYAKLKEMYPKEYKQVKRKRTGSRKSQSLNAQTPLTRQGVSSPVRQKSHITVTMNAGNDQDEGTPREEAVFFKDMSKDLFPQMDVCNQEKESFPLDSIESRRRQKANNHNFSAVDYNDVNIKLEEHDYRLENVEFRLDYFEQDKQRNPRCKSLASSFASSTSSTKAKRRILGRSIDNEVCVVKTDTKRAEAPSREYSMTLMEEEPDTTMFVETLSEKMKKTRSFLRMLRE